MLKKFLLILGIIILIYIILLIPNFSSNNQLFGITFSESYTKALNLNLKETYLAILNELNFKKIRIVAYWNLIEKEKNNFNFENLDFQINEATKRNKEIILAIGFRVPRWPECHIPQWAKNLDEKEFKVVLFNYLEKIINRYKNNQNIYAWQVENEPFLKIFGICPSPNKSLFNEEIKYIKNLDLQRKILITDSGELSSWLNTAGKSEIFGTTLYRYVWNQYTGFFKHMIPPSIYTLRAWMVKNFTNTKEVIIAELQAEPWIPNSNYSPKEQSQLFTVDDFKENINFAKKTGIKEIFLWGAEWWYFQKLNNNPIYWEEAKKLN